MSGEFVILRTLALPAEAPSPSGSRRCRVFSAHDSKPNGRMGEWARPAILLLAPLTLGVLLAMASW